VPTTPRAAALTRLARNICIYQDYLPYLDYKIAEGVADLLAVLISDNENDKKRNARRF